MALLFLLIYYSDIGTMDETGHVTYIGRKVDCVRFKHFSDVVYPSKILNVVEANEKIQNAKVFFSLLLALFY